MTDTFPHQQSAHCESGVMAAVARTAGQPLSEAMAFGLSGALGFAYLPFIKLSGLPLIAYRMPPGAIIRGLAKALGMKVHFETFRSPRKAEQRLNELLDGGQVVGLQTSVFWLPYFPRDMRFHFNAHNLLVYGRDGDDYLISDPVFEHPVRCARADLERARFAKGALAPKGRLYYTDQLAVPPDWEKVGLKAIRRVCRIMLQPLMPIAGVKGIRTLAKAVGRLPSSGDTRHSLLFIGHIIRMQEEIGTGGAGFRFLFAAFLQELAPLVQRPALAAAAEKMLLIGDEWREFALAVAMMVRGRKPLDTQALAQQLLQLAEREKAFFVELNTVIKR